MINKIRMTIEKYNMLVGSDSVILGVSGGADSVAMLHVFCGLSREFGVKLTVAHLNHNLRGEESLRDESFVKAICEQFKVEFILESSDVAGLARSRGLSLEEAGREARYAFFSRCCSNHSKIAVAHNLNDSVETMLLNLARGTALRGLCGISPTRDNIIRPLIDCERREIEDYCKENGLDFITDSSNLGDDFARNRLRHHAMGALASVNENFLKNAATAFATLREDADYLDELASKEFCFDNNTFLREKYLEHHSALRYRILAKMLSQREIPVAHARLTRLDEIIRLGNGGEQLADNLYFKAHAEYFVIEEPHEHTRYFTKTLEIPGVGETVQVDILRGKILRLMNTDYEHCEENIKYPSNPLKNALDCAKIDGCLIARQKLPGDKIRLSGRNCTKTLKKLFNESKILPHDREKIIVLADNGGVVWVEGFGVSEYAAVSQESKRIIILNLHGGIVNER